MIIETKPDGEMICEGGYSIRKKIIHDEMCFNIYYEGVRINRSGHIKRAFELIEEMLSEKKQTS